MRAAVHVGQLLQPVPGGIGRYVRRLVAHLPAAGVDPVPFAAGPDPGGVPAYVDLGRPTGPVRYELWHRTRRPALRVPGDVVHATSLAIPPHGRRPLVVTVHDLVFVHHPQHLTARGVSFHRRGLALAREEAAAVLVPTAAVADELAVEGFDLGRVHVAHHGVEPVPPPDPAATAAELVRLGVVAPFVLFVGTIEPRKGIDDLLAAHQLARRTVPDLGLVLAGAPGWGEPPDLDRPGVVVTGGVGDASLDALYRSAAALALPSRYEGFGMPVVEAMAHGCPVVTSDAAALVEVGGGATRTVPVGDVDELAATLGELASDPDRRRALADAGRARAERFTWHASAAAHAGAYAAAVADSGTS